jgi:cytochrome c-type biogenesis protein
LNIDDISYLAAILAGALSFLSPCVLPLVPPYLCYMAGVSIDDFRTGGGSEGRARRSILLASLFFTLGFSTVFVALGAGASTIGGLLRSNMDVLSWIAGIVIIVMGLHFLGVFRIGILNREARFQSGGTPATITGAYVMGLAFAFGWTPCIGPVLGAILGIASAKQTVGDGAMLLAFYSLGLAVPFWVAAAFSGLFMHFMIRFRRYLGTVERVMGGLLVATGVLFVTGGMERMAYWLLQTFPVFQQIG